MKRIAVDGRSTSSIAATSGGGVTTTDGNITHSSQPASTATCHMSKLPRSVFCGIILPFLPSINHVMTTVARVSRQFHKWTFEASDYWTRSDSYVELHVDSYTIEGFLDAIKLMHGLQLTKRVQFGMNVEDHGLYSAMNKVIMQLPALTHVRFGWRGVLVNDRGSEDNDFDYSPPDREDDNVEPILQFEIVCTDRNAIGIYNKEKKHYDVELTCRICNRLSRTYVLEIKQDMWCRNTAEDTICDGDQFIDNCLMCDSVPHCAPLVKCCHIGKDKICQLCKKDREEQQNAFHCTECKADGCMVHFPECRSKTCDESICNRCPEYRATFRTHDMSAEELAEDSENKEKRCTHCGKSARNYFCLSCRSSGTAQKNFWKTSIIKGDDKKVYCSSTCARDDMVATIDDLPTDEELQVDEE